MRAGRVLGQWIDWWHGQTDPNKTYHYSNRKKPESAYGRFLTVISVGLGIAFFAIQIVATVHIGQSIEDQQLQQAQKDAAARCADNPWAVGCPPADDAGR